MLMHTKSVEDSKAFTLYGAVTGFSIGKYATYPFDVTAFLVQYCANSCCTHASLNDELGFVIINWVWQE
uniref:Uncharacterized protein n=1 Tax=Romanomermis culicivorax TaxID=13658 RepID=A0A915KTU0_ROMCU